MHSDPEFGQREGEVLVILMPGRKGSGTQFQLAFF
jgi:hypothetical protein